jgi:NAD(P)-dependent dehydrogenase (short-subunit alcohol dehydrogenase family)
MELAMSTQAQYPSLKGQTVLITGGAAGIGASLTASFIAQGAKVGFLDYDRDAASVLLAEMDSPNAHFEYCDLRDIEALRAAIKKVSAALGPVTILINNAARD